MTAENNHGKVPDETDVSGRTPSSGASELPAGHTTLGGTLRLALAGYRRAIDREMAAAGFTDRRFPEGRVLTMVSGPGQMTISDVGRMLGITRQGASKIVAQLRQSGYLDVTPSPGDGREKILSLTPRAVEFLAALRKAARTVENRLRRRIGPDGVAQLREFLTVLAEEPGAAADLLGEFPGIRALRWRDAEDA